MSDQAEAPAIVRRVTMINDALQTLGKNIEVSDKQEGETLNAALTLVGVFLVSVAEIADSVGRMANLTQSEFETQVAAGVDDAADKKIAESKKRSFFGQPT